MTIDPDEIDWSLFTVEEISAVLSLVANAVPFCCARNQEIRHAITTDPRKRAMLASYGYEYTGCGPRVTEWQTKPGDKRQRAQRREFDRHWAAAHDERWEVYFDDLVASLSSSPIAIAGDVGTASSVQRSMSRR